MWPLGRGTRPSRQPAELVRWWDWTSFRRCSSGDGNGRRAEPGVQIPEFAVTCDEGHAARVAAERERVRPGGIPVEGGTDEPAESLLEVRPVQHRGFAEREQFCRGIGIPDSDHAVVTGRHESPPVGADDRVPDERSRQGDGGPPRVHLQQPERGLGAAAWVWGGQRDSSHHPPPVQAELDSVTAVRDQQGLSSGEVEEPLGIEIHLPARRCR